MRVPASAIVAAATTALALMLVCGSARPAAAQNCPISTANGQSSVTLNGGACTIPSGTVLSPGSTGITANNGQITANGVTVNPATNGGSTGLSANGASGLITGALSVNMNGFGNATGATASGGAAIVLGSGSTVTFGSGGGGNVGIAATGAGSSAKLTGTTVAVPANGNSGGNDVGVSAGSGAAIALSGGSISVGSLGSGGGETGLLATGSTLTANGTAVTVAGGGGDAGVRALSGSAVALTSVTVSAPGTSGGETGILVSGAGSTLTANGVTVGVPSSSGGRGAQASSGGALKLGAGSAIGTGGDGAVAVQATGAGSSIAAAGTAITTTGSGGAGVQADTAGTVSLGGGSTVTTSGRNAAGLLASGSGSSITANGLPVVTTGSNAPAGLLQNGGTIALTGGTVTATGAGSQGFLFQGPQAAISVLTLDGTPVNSAADVFAVQGGSANITTSGVTASSQNGVVLSATQGAAVALNAVASTFTGVITTDGSSASTVSLGANSLFTMTGNSTVTNLFNNNSTIVFTPPTGDPTQFASYKTLTTVNYVGTNGTVVLNTFLGADNSPSDRIIVNGGNAPDATGLTINNTTGPGAVTVANGIPVVVALNGGTTAPGAFSLNNVVLAGPFEYLLFRGGVNGSNPNDWFLRSTFGGGPFVPSVTLPAVPGSPSGPAPAPAPQPTPSPPTSTPAPVPPPGPGSPSTPTPPGTVVVEPDPADPFPTDPPPQPLPPMEAFPIVVPRLATYGVVQPIARQLGLTELGTLHERIGDTLTEASAGAADQGWGSSGWARVIGQQIDNRYQAFADPRASGRLIGMQAGFDVWRGSFAPGHRDAAGLYFAYANGNVDVDGLVTNASATGYVLERTGSLNLDGYSLGGYWTHYGPGGWYLDAVLQGTRYDGDAQSLAAIPSPAPGVTPSTKLQTRGSGVIASLEAGYPLPLPSLGPGFILEPQAQILYQHVDFGQADDGLNVISLGGSSGATGRLGVRAQWTIASQDGAVWQPYARGNVWRDWGGTATTLFLPSTIPVSLVEQATRLEFAGGLTVKCDTHLSFYAQVGYQFAVSPTDVQRDGVKGDLGLRVTW